ncbi:hypothetical protein V8D89_009738 [Ganoderma adspersum]
MNAAQVLQTVLSVIPQPQPGTPPVIASGAPPGSTTSQLPALEATLTTPMSLPQMIVSIFSMAAFWDWAKLLLIGAFFEVCRRGSSEASEWAIDHVWVTAEFQSDGDGCEWLMYWLSQKKVFQKARSIEVRSPNRRVEGMPMNDLEDGEQGAALIQKDRVAFLPSLSRTYSLWHRGRYMTVTRTRIQEGSVWKGPIDMFKIRILARDPGLLRELLKEARDAYKAANGHLINVYVAQDGGIEDWSRVATQQKRPMSSVILDPGVIELVLEDAKDFLNSRKWYADRGIPFRWGYLLHGAPGSGKTSMIHSIAGELGLGIYILSLTVMSLNDNSLKSLISHLPKSCILLMEDIDAAFARGLPRREIAGPEMPAPSIGAENAGEGADGTQGPGGRDGGFNGVTLSGLLNALDGIAAQEGRILFATTNDYAALDPALLRPGRLDLHIEFGLASEHQARELFKRFYTASPDMSAEGELEDDDEDESEKDSGYASCTDSPVRESGDSVHSTEGSQLLAIPQGVKSVYVGMTRTGHDFQLPPKKAAALAERFAAAIPPHTFSMAMLQGYLMAYKVRPYIAVEEAPAWVEKKMRENATQGAAKKGGSTSGMSTFGKTEGSS